MNCIQCSICQCWLHSECLNLSHQEFESLANSTSEFICSSRCNMLLFPFHSVDSNDVTNFFSIEFDYSVSRPSIPSIQSDIPKFYSLNNQTPYFDQFLEINCSYLKPQSLKDDYFKKSDSELIVMHHNVCSISANFDKVEEFFLGSNFRPHPGWNAASFCAEDFAHLLVCLLKKYSFCTGFLLENE